MAQPQQAALVEAEISEDEMEVVEDPGAQVAVQPQQPPAQQPPQQQQAQQSPAAAEPQAGSSGATPIAHRTRGAVPGSSRAADYKLGHSNVQQKQKAETISSRQAKRAHAVDAARSSSKVQEKNVAGPSITRSKPVLSCPMKRSAHSSSSSQSTSAPFVSQAEVLNNDGELSLGVERKGVGRRPVRRRDNKPFLTKIGEHSVFPSGVIEYDPSSPVSQHQTMIAYSAQMIRSIGNFVVPGAASIVVNGSVIMPNPPNVPTEVHRQQVLQRIVDTTRRRHPTAITFCGIRQTGHIVDGDAPAIYNSGNIASKNFRDFITPVTANAQMGTFLSNHMSLARQFNDNMALYVIGWIWYDFLLAAERAALELPVGGGNNAHIHIGLLNQGEQAAQMLAISNAINGGYMHFPANQMTPQYAACMRLISNGAAHFWAANEMPEEVPHAATFQYAAIDFFVYSILDYALPDNVRITAAHMWDFLQAMAVHHHDQSAMVRGFNTAAVIVNGVYFNEVNPAHVREQREFDAKAAAAAEQPDEENDEDDAGSGSDDADLTEEQLDQVYAAHERRCNKCVFRDLEFCRHNQMPRPTLLKRPEPQKAKVAPPAVDLEAEAAAARRAANLRGIDRYWTSGFETGNLQVAHPFATNFLWTLLGLIPPTKLDTSLRDEADVLANCEVTERVCIMALVAGIYSLGASAVFHFDSLIGRELNYWAGQPFDARMKNGSRVGQYHLSEYEGVTTYMRVSAGAFAAQITKATFAETSFLGPVHGSGPGNFVSATSWALFNGPWPWRIPYIWDVFALTPMFEGFLNLWGVVEAPSSYRIDDELISVGVNAYDGLHLAMGDAAYTTSQNEPARREYIEYGVTIMNCMHQSLRLPNAWAIHYEGLHANKGGIQSRREMDVAQQMLPLWDPVLHIYVIGTFMTYSYVGDLILAPYMLRHEIPNGVWAHMKMKGVLFTERVGFFIPDRTPSAPLMDSCLSMRERRPASGKLQFRITDVTSSTSAHLNASGPE